MGGRCLITGVQIGMMKTFLSMKDTKKVDKLLDEILENQFIYDSESSIEEDIEKWKGGSRKCEKR